jgi:hypothetical protein
VEVNSAAGSHLPAPGFHPVYSRDGERIGRAEAFTVDAFKVAIGTDECLWLKRETIGRTTPGGVIFLRIRRSEITAWRHIAPEPQERELHVDPATAGFD